MSKPLAAVFISLMLQSTLSQVEIRNSQPIDVTLLNLLDYAVIYNNCRIRVRGEYKVTGRPAIVMRDAKRESLLASILLEFEDDIDIVKEYRKMSVEEFVRLVYSGELKNALSNIPWLTPLPVKPLPASQVRAVLRKTKGKYDRSIEILVVGRFDYAGAGRLMMRRDGTVSWRIGFGAEPEWPYRIVVESIRILKETKVN